MPSASHVSNIAVNTYLESLATPGAGFGTVTLMVDENLGNPLNTDSTPTQRYVDFAEYSEAQAADAASEITAEVLTACLVAFSQPLAPCEVPGLPRRHGRSPPRVLRGRLRAAPR